MQRRVQSLQSLVLIPIHQLLPCQEQQADSIWNCSGTLATTNKNSLTIGDANTGNIILNGFGAGALQTNANGVLSYGQLSVANGGTGANLTLSSQNANGSIPYFSGGIMTTVGLGGNGTCLISNGSIPTWGSCAGGATNFWQLVAGAISPLDSHNDLLVGGNATASAKFGLLNVSNGTPTASIAGSIANNALYLPGDGSIGTTNRITLALGGGGTGNISLQDERLTSPVLLTQTATVLDAGLGTNGIIDAINKAYEAAGGGTGGCWTLTGNVIYPSALTNQVGIGTSSVGNGQLVVNQPNTSGDIFSASASGPAKFTIGNTGTVTLNNYISCGSLTTNSSGILTCSGAPGGTNFWDSLNGVLTPKIETQDLLLGSSATVSAKFAVTGIDTNTTVASVSGSTGGIYLNSTGKLATTNLQSLTLGDSNTGNINFYNGNNVLTSAGNLTLAGNITAGTYNGNTITASTGTLTLPAGNTVSFAGAFTTSGANALTLTTTGSTTVTLPTSGTLCADNTTVCGFALGTNYLQSPATGVLSTFNSSYDVLLGGNATTSAKFAFLNNAGSATPVASISALNAAGNGLVLNASGSLQSLYNNTLTIGGGTTGNIALMPNNGVGGLVSVTGILNASTDLRVNGVSVCQSNGTNCPAAGASAAYWQLNTNALSPGNSNFDLLLGGNSTASAKFAFLNNAGSATPVASISCTDIRR